ncbi:hypothetical protein TDB9533_03999 [Thalassocella blandensis]|nr:hypothetical protein TDB9533_03999 [Thalassocella blandensis]
MSFVKNNTLAMTKTRFNVAAVIALVFTLIMTPEYSALAGTAPSAPTEDTAKTNTAKASVDEIVKRAVTQKETRDDSRSNPTLKGCQLDPDYVVAEYKITRKSFGAVNHSSNESSAQSASSNAITTTKFITLVRNGKEVAHYYPQAHITEIWNQVKDGRTKVVRYFDQHRRGIEYQPHDLNKGKGDKNWDGKYQLMEREFIQSLPVEQQTGDACDLQQRLVLQTAQRKTVLLWLPNKKLVQHFSQRDDVSTTTWELISLSAGEQGKRDAEVFFKQRESFQTTDYADIGDSESDPFFRQLINLGFVSHGASGFYDADGHALEGGHTH